MKVEFKKRETMKGRLKNEWKKHAGNKEEEKKESLKRKK